MSYSAHIHIVMIKFLVVQVMFLTRYCNTLEQLEILVYGHDTDMVPTLFQIQNSRIFQGPFKDFFFVKNSKFGGFFIFFIKYHTTPISEITIL